MNKDNIINTKINNLVSERETILKEMEELQRAYTTRQQKIIEINGGLMALQDLITEEKSKTESDKKE